MSNVQVDERQAARPRFASFVRRFSPLIIIGWVAVMLLLGATVPALEVVEREHSVSLSPADAPSVKAAERMGAVFQESTGGAVAVLVLEGQQPHGPDAHRY
jgi:RND superfamily putative drug exporter